ncbi:MAG: ROK family protein [Tissierellaceae bacterium]|nr:ROK family protein [Tissierellaceae bacterium]
MKIGIDIGGTNIIIGLVNSNLDLVYKEEMPTNGHRGYEYIRDQIISSIESMIWKARELNRGIKSMGIGIPGIADVKGDTVIYSANLNWRNVPLGRDIKDKFNLPVYMENDATVAGIAESAVGVSKGYANSVFITIGTGIGGGIIINHKVHKGSHGIGSEIGHTIVGENFYDCNCGNNGCLETFASSKAIENYVKMEIENGFKDTTLLNIGQNINTKSIFQGAEKGDKLSNMAVDRMTKYLAIGIVNIINIIDPDIIVLGGGVAKAGDFLLKRVREQLSKFILYKEIKYGKIELAKLGNDAGVIGAAMLEEYN